MAGPLDAQLNLGVESTYGTGVTPSRTYEWDISASTHQWDPKVVSGSGMQVGDGGFGRIDRVVPVIGQGTGTVAMDYQTKGMGLIIKGATGDGVSTLVSGSTYQELFTSNLATSLLQSFTMQYGVVRSDSAGTVDPYTYLGVTFDALTISCDSGDVMKMTTDWDAKARTEATALAATAYPAGLLDPFHYGEIVATIGGSLTLPTTNTLGSGGTAVSNVKSFTFKLANNSDKDRWVFGSRNQPRVASRDDGTELTFTAEYDSTTYDNAQTANTTVPVTLTATKVSQPLSTGNATWQLVIPAAKVTSTNRPQPTSSTPTVEYTIDIKKPATGAAFYIVHRTAANAL